MKKFLLIVLLIICFVPCIVFADMGAPESTSYDVIITNPEGVSIGSGKKKTTIPAGEKVTVNYEYENSGTLYGSIEYNGIYGEIDLSDARVYTTDIDLSKFANEGKTELYVFKEGAYLYKGPSTVYGKVDGDVMIPVGTTVTYTYHDEMWAYVDYKGTKGWIYFYGPSQMYSSVTMAVATPIKEKNKALILEKIDKLMTDPGNSNSAEIDVNIPAGTELTYDLYFSLGYGRYIHVNYEGKEGWLAYHSYRDFADSGIVIEDICTDGTIMKDLNIYSKFGDPSSKTDEVISKGTKVVSLYSYREGDYYWNKVKFNDREAWIGIQTPEEDYDAYLPIAYEHSYYYVYRVRKEANIYKDVSADSEVLGTIPMNEQLDVNYTYYDETSNWAYVEYNGISGWVDTNNTLDFVSTEEKASCKISANSSKEKLDNDEDTNEKHVNNVLRKSIITACIVAAVIAVVMSITIVFVNKKKKTK